MQHSSQVPAIAVDIAQQSEAYNTNVDNTNVGDTNLASFPQTEKQEEPGTLIQGLKRW